MENISSNNQRNQQENQLPIFTDDPQLLPYKKHFDYLFQQFSNRYQEIIKNEGSLINFANSYKTRGIFKTQTGVCFKEWAPSAQEIYLMGDFNDWKRDQYKANRDAYGNWTIEVKNGPNNEPGIKHMQKVKVHLKTQDGQWVDRIPVYVKYAIQNEPSKRFDGVFWDSPNPYQFKNPVPKRQKAPRIYECHIGMSGIEPRVHTFKEFTQNVLPRIVSLEYNIIQIMAIAEHAYYGSFGYHVTLPFAISSRFGSLDDFKELIDTAHGFGIQVLIDLVHSHASTNVDDGINQWDGSDHHYFHAGVMGVHTLWDSRIYCYSNYETLRLLLSNVAYFIQEFKIDGFRFDGITSLMYKHHGIGVGFTGNYTEYFNETMDIDGLVYLMLANQLIHQLNDQAITVAEDVSGYPTLGRSLEDGGLGFDFRLSMAVPDKWIQLLKEHQDETWSMQNLVNIFYDLVYTLTNRRHKEPVITYSESHDQALVGDKTIAMWLFDKQMYTNMSQNSEETPVISRGISLHKMIRILTFALGGEGWLNFMGNEFGHPEWIDFPREGNGWSYHHCRRRWDLVDDKSLRYQFLNNFDRAIMDLDLKYEILSNYETFVSEQHEENKVIAFEHGVLLFVLNFHPTKSYPNYRIGTKWNKDHKLILDSDDSQYGGHNRLTEGYKVTYVSHNIKQNERPYSILAYLPSRTVSVFTAPQ